ncbi:PAS domain S-box protein [Thermodesulfobacteriota bacterium]
MMEQSTVEELEQKIEKLETDLKEVREQLKLFTSVYEQSSTSVVIIDPQGIVEYANPKSLQVYNIDRHELIGKPLASLLSLDSSIGDRISEIRHKVLEKGEIWQGEFFDFNKNGEKFWREAKLLPVKDETDQMTHIVYMGDDITDRKLAEEALKESEERHRSFIDNAPIGMYTLNANGEFTYGNKRLLQMTGYQIEDWLNKPFHPIVYPQDLDTVLDKIQKRLSGKGSTEPFEIRIYNASGEIIWVKITSESIFETDETGEKRIKGMQSFVEDVTAQKRAEEKLVESEAKYRNLVENLNDGIAVQKGDEIKYVNKQTLEIFGFQNEEEMLGRRFTEFLTPEYKNMMEVFEAKRDKTSKASAHYEFKGRRKDGSVFDAELSASSILFEGEMARQGVIRDITDRKQMQLEKERLEAQLLQVQKMEAIGTLAGGIAHDFNNILSGIIGYTQLAQMELSGGRDAIAHELSGILEAGIRAKDLVKQILAFSRHGDQEFKPVKPNHTVKEALKLLRASLPAMIEIRQNIKSNAIIWGEPTQLHQIMMNLCTNAFHAMRENGGVLGVELEDVTLNAADTTDAIQLQPGRYVRLVVSDTGHGMDTHILQRLFDPYFTTKKATEGTGLGLSVVHGIINSHGGAIDVKSSPGKGSTFTVVMPAIEKDEKKERMEKPRLLAGNERVLFVDDETIFCDMVERLLTNLGYKVVVRQNSLEALADFQAGPDDFDIVITDQTMPKLTGIQLASELIKLRPDIPIVLCTGFSEQVNEDTAADFGVSEFLLKPFNLGKLVEIIRKLLDS